MGLEIARAMLTELNAQNPLKDPKGNAAKRAFKIDHSLHLLAFQEF
jgi:hypothetical protein